MRHGGHHGPGRHGHGGDEHKQGAQTFRRGRALAFLETLNVKRQTLVEQLQQPEMQEIQSIIVGELKAIDMVRNEFVAMFDLHEFTDEHGNPTPTDGPNQAAPATAAKTAPASDTSAVGDPMPPADDPAAGPDPTPNHTSEDPEANP